MKFKKKKELIDLVKSVEESLDYIKKVDLNQAREILDNCNACLTLVSEHISNEKQVNEVIQDILMGILLIKSKLGENSLVNQKITDIKMKISKVIRMLDEVIKAELEIVFMPYKASMWDSFDSIYREAMNDPECNVYVVPIPFYEKNEQGQIVRFCYEGNDLPEDVETIPFELYKFEERKPDVVYIHNPFDNYNRITVVNPRFFSENLSKHTNMLVYIPYYIAGSALNPQLNVPYACSHVNKIVVQSPKLKEAYINSGVSETKLLNLGSPKIDASLKRNESKNTSLNFWKQNQNGQKIFLLNTGIADLLSTQTWYSQIETTINFFLENPEYSLIWRPHPLTEVTLKTMRPNIRKSYEEKMSKLGSSSNIFIDHSSDAYAAMDCSDALISDYSSILFQYIVTGKPVLGLLSEEEISENRFCFSDYLGCYFTGEGDTVSQFVEMVINNQDFKKEERISRFIKSITNSDGTSGKKIHVSIKLDLMNSI